MPVFCRWMLGLLLWGTLAIGEDLPRLIADPSKSTQYRVPEGWHVSVSENKGVYTWFAEAKPGQPSSPSVLVVAIPTTDGNPDKETTVRALLQPIVSGLEWKQKQTDLDGTLHAQLTGRIQKVDARLTTLVTEDPTTKLLFAAFFVAPPAAHQELGGDRLLTAMLGREAVRWKGNPIVVKPASSPVAEERVPNSAKGGARLNMQDPNVKLKLLQQNQAIAPADLVGTWMQVVASTDGTLYQNRDGATFTGSRGQGHLLELKKDGSYRLQFRYEIVSSAGQSKAEVVETGRYRLQKGNQLRLDRTAYEAQYRIMGSPKHEKKTRLPAKSFMLGLSKDKQALVLYGFPFEYSVSTETNEKGESYILEGFHRQ